MIDKENEGYSIRRTTVPPSFREKDQDATRPSENRLAPEVKDGELR